MMEKHVMVYNDEQWSSMDGLAKRPGGLGGAQPLAFANNMICVAIPHGDDTTLL